MLKQIFFATEVIAGRDILFFDRPTSDLDAQSALSVVTALQRVSRSGKLVVVTAGSLTFREYAILDRIQLISNKGTYLSYFYDFYIASYSVQYRRERFRS